MSNKIVALFPMKAVSERVVGKNFRNFNGKPLFRWVLDTLLSIDVIDQIVINTDARDILAQNGLIDSDKILIRDRRPEIQGHHVSMNRVIEDDVNNIDSDIYLMTHTTNPLLSVKTIMEALSAYKTGVSNGNYDSLFTVDMIQTRFYRGDGSPVNHDADNLIPTQDLEVWYEENSNLFIFSKKSFLKTKARIGRNPILFLSPKYESVDIDTEEDWFYAVNLSSYVKSAGQ